MPQAATGHVWGILPPYPTSDNYRHLTSNSPRNGRRFLHESFWRLKLTAHKKTGSLFWWFCRKGAIEFNKLMEEKKQIYYIYCMLYYITIFIFIYIYITLYYHYVYTYMCWCLFWGSRESSFNFFNRPKKTQVPKPDHPGILRGLA